MPTSNAITSASNDHLHLVKINDPLASHVTSSAVSGLMANKAIATAANVGDLRPPSV